jgi:hypothetical protein
MMEVVVDQPNLEKVVAGAVAVVVYQSQEKVEVVVVAESMTRAKVTPV